MPDKIIESLAPTNKQRILYYLLGILTLRLIPPLPEWLSWVSISPLLPQLDTDRATIILFLSTLLLAYSVYSLKKEKDFEISQLKTELTSRKSACESLAETVQRKNEQINKLQLQINLQEAKDGALSKLNKDVRVVLDLPHDSAGHNQKDAPFTG